MNDLDRLQVHAAFITMLVHAGWPLAGLLYVAAELERRRAERLRSG